MTDDAIRDDKLAECLEDHYRRRARGEPEVVDGYATALGEKERAEFRRHLATEEAIDALLEPPESALLPRPFGAYTLLREIGRGAMGVVYEALHRDLGRKVALKVLRAGVDLDVEARARFRREARSCAQVRHPNIVEIYEAGEEDGQPYYAMELVAGRPLSELARDGKYEDSRELFRGIAGVADALAALHAAGIVHRDVKPSNVIVGEDGRMILADFGLARSLSAERMTATGQALGTPLYMSPEQVMGRADAIDGRADVYGLGVTLYEVLAGRGPFRADDPIAMLRMILRERPDPLADVAPGVPAEACAVVMKALEKLPADRYPTAAALRDDLLAHADGRAVEGRPVSRLVRAARTARRLAPAAAACVVAAAAAGWAWTHRDATVHVTCWPTATVTIDEVARGVSPVTARLAPGRHDLTLALDGFVPHSERLDLEPGEAPPVQRILVARSGGDVAALREMSRALNIPMKPLEPLTSERAPAEAPPTRLLWPRGDVRMEDLAELRIEFAADFDGSAKVEFRRGAESLATETFTPTNVVTARPVPDAVRAALRPGDRATWTCTPEKGAPISAEFAVTTADVQARLATIAARAKEQPSGIASHLRAQLLLDSGLFVSAYREAKALADLDPKDRLAWLVAQHALDGIGARDTRPWREACAGIAEARDGAPK